MEGFSTGLYDQRATGVNTLSQRGFMFAISIFTVFNIGVAAFASTFSYGWEFDSKWVYIGFLLVCVVVSIGGATLAHSHDDPMTSIVGGFICAGAMGLMMGPFISIYEMESVIQAFVISSGVVLLTGFIGAVMPKDLSMWGAPLFAALLGLIVAYIVLPWLLPALGVDYEFVVSILDVAGILLFSGIMVYDLNKAVRLDKTMNNAIDVAVNVFLNFANIFIRVLALMGNKK